MADPAPGSLPFEEAIRFFRQKVDLPTETWTDLWQGMHGRAFVVAMRDELVADFRTAVDRAIADGTTLAAFREDFDRIVAKHGWSYRGARGWRSRVIFETNLRTAYLAGRWEQMQRVKDRRPYLRYVAVRDARTRPQHATWHGTVLEIDDPWWGTHYPPNGWNCRCTVQSLSARQLERFGFEPSGQAPAGGLVPRSVNTPEGAVTVEVPEGIDPGWAYNVGEAAWGRGQQSLLMEAHGPFESLTGLRGSRPRLGALPFDTPVAELGPVVSRGNDRRLRRVLRDAIGGNEAVLVDPAGERVRITQALADHMIADPRRFDGRERYFPFIRELVEDPAEIWLGFARSEESGRVALRRRYIKLLDLPQARGLFLAADSEQGFWTGLTVFQREARKTDELRSGMRAYRRL